MRTPKLKKINNLPKVTWLVHMTSVNTSLNSHIMEGHWRVLNGRQHSDLELEKQTLQANSEELWDGRKNTLNFSSTPRSG